MFKNEAFTEREAWHWLVEAAAWKGGWRRINQFEVEVLRGQVAAPSRFLAKAWSWQEPRVRRFLGRLEAHGMVGLEVSGGVTLVTIQLDFPPWSGGVRSERHAATRMVIPSMLARASAGVR